MLKRPEKPKRRGGDFMKYVIIFGLVKTVYGKILRPLLVKAIDDPDEEWDDVILGIVDRIFQYTE